MAQAKALDALAPFLALAKTSNAPRQTADVISRATAQPNTFVFAELLQTPRVCELAAAEPQYAAYLTLLRIFCYGTYADYVRGTPPAAHSSAPAPAQQQTAQAPLPALDDAQQHKLRQLSLITLATDHASLTYDFLIKALHLDDDGGGDNYNGSAANLESLVVSAIYAGLLVATLDPAHRLVRVSSVAPLRDVAPGSLPKLRASLRGWAQRCETTLAELDAQLAGIHKAASARGAAEQAWDTKFKRAVEDERKAMLGWRPAGAGGGGGNGGGDSTEATGGNSSNSNSRTMTLNVGAMGGAPMMQRQQPQPVRMNKRGSSGSVRVEGGVAAAAAASASASASATAVTMGPAVTANADSDADAGDDDDDDDDDDDAFDDGAMDLDDADGA